MGHHINISQCGALFSSPNSTGAFLRSQWGYNGTLTGILPNSSSQITYAGCLAVCGTGYDPYPWSDVSGVITTWILPVIGTLLQAPFESNATLHTLLATTRWVGSPIASLSYVLWNIKVSAKAALMVDMAVGVDKTPGKGSHFESMRDSMFLLGVMNQYTFSSAARMRELQKESEGLLRITLFSRDLELVGSRGKTLREKRGKLAREVREMRRRGAVPVFVSIMWFLFAFALSIQDAFVELGANTTAHDLALGCLLAWFPVLILGSIVDRNPIAAEAIRKKLSKLVDHVHRSLRDAENRDRFISGFKDEADYPELKRWIEKIANVDECLYEQMHDFFVDFAGQARIRWHYGAAHAILSDIENCYVADKGRNWLANEHEARASLVLGPINDDGLVWFDLREFWQIWTAVIIVGGSCGGAFTLSYFTPTVGLGCRSGGYTIFFCVSLGLLIVEMTVWLFLSAACVEAAPFIRRAGSRLCRYSTFEHLDGNPVMKEWRKLKRRVVWWLRAAGNFVLVCVVGILYLLPWRDRIPFDGGIESDVEKVKNYFRQMTPQRKWELFFFRPVETFNTIWLVSSASSYPYPFNLTTNMLAYQIYIVLAQMVGWYRTCECITSGWAGGGGYVDFNQQDTANSPWVLWYWTTGAVLTGLVMGLSMFYITVEWCQQSFMSTENYDAAMNGLRRTRKYRSWTFFARQASRALSYVSVHQLEKLAILGGIVKKPQKTLLWTRGCKESSSVQRLGRQYAAPAVALTRESNNDDNNNNNAVLLRVQEPSAIVERTLSLPASGAFYRRHESDASLSPPNFLGLPLRLSADSSTPLIRIPSQTLRQNDGEVESSSEGRGRSETGLLEQNSV
ncbi:glutamine-dependent nad(+) synthetase [Pyrenophora seminiperda CCB06]|uniref:Glutamine-dependent nad(+) synthetase n=1 Tax=Pyrenophora seminiperda CCB06 TaxID=1302712 RepID=A0A3M7MDH1_9PLEO|nr:glutamine-dependent nad(+) synthetase [Pyrenophora seminiperda CCB06]